MGLGTYFRRIHIFVGSPHNPVHYLGNASEISEIIRLLGVSLFPQRRHLIQFLVHNRFHFSCLDDISVCISTAACIVPLSVLRGLTSSNPITWRATLSASVRMTVQWFVLPRESAPIVAALHALMVVARAEPGCLVCQLSTEVNGRVTLRYVEEWKEEKDLKRELCSKRFARLAELLERGTERPRVQFTLPSGVRGLDYAEEVRQRQADSK